MSRSTMPAFALRAIAVLGCACVLASGALAQTAPAKPVGKSAPKKVAPAPLVEAPVPDAAPDQVQAADMVFYGKYDCEFDQNVHITQSLKYSAYVDVQAGKSKWLMKPVLSSTGAIRLEDVRGETLMVQISSKSMLLNVKTARRIVDDCISPKQRELVEAARAAKLAEAEAAKAAAARAAEAASSPAATASSVAVGDAPAAPVAASTTTAAIGGASATR